MTDGTADHATDRSAGPGQSDGLTLPAHLVLVGLPGAGKTTHGRHAARHMHRPFIDLDKRVAHLAGRTVAEIFRVEGEQAFRAHERLATTALALEPASIVAPGGGWVLDPANVDLVKPAATVVWLKVSPRVAVQRMGGKIRLRPLLVDGDPVVKLEALLRQREARYATADAVIDTEVLDWQGVVHAIAALAAGGPER